jgi:hypothetical protein
VPCLVKIGLVVLEKKSKMYKTDGKIGRRWTTGDQKSSGKFKNNKTKQKQKKNMQNFYHDQ